MNLNTGMHHPYKKPGDHTTYINVDSNHPPNIIQQIPETINKRLSELSSDKRAFDNAVPNYILRPSSGGGGAWQAFPPVRISAPRCPPLIS
ncbi:hypothetical protein HOLleu_02783 [Holothuria leucospilota]|uniref:Uncharacterized protein n=1 Tax=Holothuria leucospilota TaxID=206669 RepID=A0A9Q1HLL4_HOLLE|nr:hypothetical protein HOLleu_02783 [Holothuria leucospilota]